MCESCGCGDPKVMPFEIHERILAGNDRVARHNREHFRDHDVVSVNLMGSPGAGKTAILEATARALGSKARLGVLAGDLATENDATRIRAAGILAESITTGSACHLDAEMVHRGLHQLPWRTLDYLFIENVGNLVCPAIYDLGQDVNVVPHLPDVSLYVIQQNLTLVMPRPAMLVVSAKTGLGMDYWIRWLEGVGRPRSAPCTGSAGAGQLP
ncbi:MAG: hydrogenase nickel incorporation protein HypB [Acidobacteria bacterium]|nr:hydrogenase nickel incorporation protein HypB [Acidobacteriota bacterium]